MAHPIESTCFLIKTASFIVAGTVGEQTITLAEDLDMIPKAVLFYLGGGEVEDSVHADAMFGVGAAAPDGQWAFATFADDSSATIVVKRFAIDNGCLIIGDNTGIIAEAEFVAFVENGVTINWTQVSGDAHKGFAVFFMGNTLSVACGTVENPTTLGTIIADLGFSPELIYGVSTFSEFGIDDERYGISQGFWFDGQQFCEQSFAGSDGGTVIVDSEAGAKLRAHYSLSKTDRIAIDALDGDLASPLRGGYKIVDVVQDSFKVQAMNALSSTKDFAYMAFSFMGQARFTRTLWDLSNLPSGDYTKFHSNTEIEIIEALFLLPRSKLCRHL
jgi:hypothetical protein